MTLALLGGRAESVSALPSRAAAPGCAQKRDLSVEQPVGFVILWGKGDFVDLSMERSRVELQTCKVKAVTAHF